MNYVLDASVFFSDIRIEGACSTTPSVVAELRDLTSKCRFETMRETGLSVQEPTGASRTRVGEAAEATGDAPVLSQTDTDVLALALDLDATVVSDDFAVQNVAHRLGIPVHPIMQRRARPRQWKYRCTGCGRYADREGICEFCGAPVKRKLK